MKQRRYVNLLFAFAVFFLLIGGCKKGGFNLFTLAQDQQFGMQFDQEIQKDTNYNILEREGNEQAYQYLEAMRDRILASGQLTNADRFVWKVTIINDTILNAFATPGGYMYFYTGLIQYLNDASSLAGVMGHEMAHADRRHSTSQMSKRYGVGLLLQFLGGNQSAIGQIVGGLVSLKFSRKDESDADSKSVQYLCPTTYRANGAGDFFSQLIADGATPGVPEFLSTHPNPENRVASINANAGSLTCEKDTMALTNGMTYTQFKNLF